MVFWGGHFRVKYLCEVGDLNEIKAGKEKLFVHPKLLQLITKVK